MNIYITNSTCGKHLGVKFDHKLNFVDCISELSKKACRKIHALARAPPTPYMNLSKKRILMSSFFFSQFSYRLIVWMRQSHANNSK